MIQGGDPDGTGMGGPGYKFQDEFDSSLGFDTTGILAMANSGPGTNGSQFFITVAPTPHLNGKHTIFGKVTDGYEIVDAISKVAQGSGNRPTETVTIESIEIQES
jgi:peptidyl-prolyl cis-trans isomerase A (cyclophilin A)